MIFPDNKSSHKTQAAIFALAISILFIFSFAAFAQDEAEQYIVPVRPTVCDSAEIQKRVFCSLNSAVTSISTRRITATDRARPSRFVSPPVPVSR
jgi:hypothetical protein